MKDPTTRKGVIAVIAIVVGVIVLNLIAAGLDDAVGGNEPSGEPGSAYSTTSTGLGGYAQLLAAYDYPIRRQRGALADADLDPDGALFVVGTTATEPLTPDEIATVTDFVDAGGRAILVGLDAATIEAISGVDIDAVSGAARYTSFAPALGDLSVVRANGGAAYDPAGVDVAVLASEGDVALLVSTGVGDGEVLLLADSAPIENDLLVVDDNAAFGLTLPGPEGTTVTFAEGIHGYGESDGISAIPTEWKVALLGLLAALVVFAWARGRRLGPPDQPNRTLPPPRGEYVDALAGSLARTREPAAALDGLDTWARARVARRAGLGAEFETAELERAARELGFDDAEIAALSRPPRNDAEVLSLGRAVARASEGTLE